MVVVVFISLRSNRTTTIFSPKQEWRACLCEPFRFAPLPLTHPTPPTCPARKKTTLRGKNRANPAVNGRQPQPSFRYAPLRAICVCHPRSTRRRLAPLNYAGKKSLRYRSANFLPAPFRLKAALPALFLCYARANPRPPTPKTVSS
jgi:hypothetical protein